MFWKLCATAAVAAALFSFWYFKFRHRYLGFGWMLDSGTDGTVRVASHLLESPAGRRQIPLGSQLLEWNNISFENLTKEEFRERVKKLQPLRAGEDAVFRLRYPANAITEHLGNDTFVVRMRAEVIQGPIPVYGALPYPQEDEWRYQRGMAACKKTGQWIPTVRLSEEAVDRVFEKR